MTFKVVRNWLDNHEDLDEIVLKIGGFGKVLEEKNWEKLAFGDTEEFYQMCECVHPSLFAHSPDLFTKMEEVFFVFF